MKGTTAAWLLLPMLLLFTGAEGDRVSYSGYLLLAVPHQLEEHQIKYLQNKVDFWTSPRQNGTDVTFMATPKSRDDVKDYLISQNVEFTVQLDDVQAGIDEELEGEEDPLEEPRSKRATLFDLIFGGEELSSAAVPTRGRRPRKIEQFDDPSSAGRDLDQELRDVRVPKMNWKRYHRLSTIYDWLERLSIEHRDLVRLQIIGVTDEGRNILLVKVGKNKPGKRKPGIFIEGGIHAREWISPASVTYLINDLVTNREQANLVETYDFYIVPVLNPDGYEYSHREDRMWRKNRSKNVNLLNLITNCRGVDLNRNYGYSWGELSILDSPQKGTPLPCLETYIGQGPFSEKETQAVKNFIESMPGRFVAYLAFHSFGSKIIYPWSYKDDKVPDWQDLHLMANVIAEEVFNESGGTDYYRIGTASDIQYKATGGADDWARGGAGIKWVYLVELPGKGRSFLLPPKWIGHVGRTTVAGVTGLANSIINRL